MKPTLVHVISQPKRAIILIALLITAALLHMLFCHWSWGDPSRAFILGYFDSKATKYYGLQASSGISGPEGGVLGLILPLLLVLACVYLIFHWRDCTRRALDCCAGCGHALQGSARCPECGLGR